MDQIGLGSMSGSSWNELQDARERGRLAARDMINRENAAKAKADAVNLVVSAAIRISLRDDAPDYLCKAVHNLLKIDGADI
jgi:hypothetical protein